MGEECSVLLKTFFTQRRLFNRSKILKPCLFSLEGCHFDEVKPVPPSAKAFSA